MTKTLGWNTVFRSTRLTLALRVFSVLLTLALGACAGGPNQIRDYEARQRDYQLPVDLENSGRSGGEGSLWASQNRGNFLYTDQRASRPGDLLTVRVEEAADARRNASTTTSRDSETAAAVDAFLGLIERLESADSNISGSSLISTSSSSSFAGSGETNRSESLSATVQVIVREVYPNDTLFVEGHRVILVNEEEHHFYVSGVIRQIDIDDRNEVSSSRLADAQIEFTGRGLLSEQQRPGFFPRYFGWIWPF